MDFDGKVDKVGRMVLSVVVGRLMGYLRREPGTLIVHPISRRSLREHYAIIVVVRFANITSCS